jgi:hypothetical protein
MNSLKNTHPTLACPDCHVTPGQSHRKGCVMLLEWTETEPGTWTAPGINGYILEVGPGNFEVRLSSDNCIAHAAHLEEAQDAVKTFVMQQGGMYDPSDDHPDAERSQAVLDYLQGKGDKPHDYNPNYGICDQSHREPDEDFPIDELPEGTELLSNPGG